MRKTRNIKSSVLDEVQKEIIREAVRDRIRPNAKELSDALGAPFKTVYAYAVYCRKVMHPEAKAASTVSVLKMAPVLRGGLPAIEGHPIDKRPETPKPEAPRKPAGVSHTRLLELFLYWRLGQGNLSLKQLHELTTGLLEFAPDFDVCKTNQAIFDLLEKDA